MDNVVRLYVQKLQKVTEAANIVRKTRSKESALILADYFKTRAAYQNVIEFLLIAGLLEDAFKVAVVYFSDLICEIYNWSTATERNAILCRAS
jgi:WD repeat-containing protein 19